MTLLVSAGMGGRRDDTHDSSAAVELWQQDNTGAPRTAGAARVTWAGWVDHRLGYGEFSRWLSACMDRGQLSAVRRLRGDFVVAHSSPQGELTFLRSWSGLTSLHVARTPRGATWSTVLTDLDGAAGFDLDYDRLAALLLLDRLAPGNNVLRGVSTVPAGATLRLDPAGILHWEHETLRAEDRSRLAVRDAGRELRTRLSEAVRAVCGAERDPVVLVSGGLDSSAVAFESRRWSPATSAFTYTYPGLSAMTYADRHAADMADFLKLRMLSVDAMAGLSLTEVMREAAAARQPVFERLSPIRLLYGEDFPTDRSRVLMTGLFADNLFEGTANEASVNLGVGALNPWRAGCWPWQLTRQALTHLWPQAVPRCTSPAASADGRYETWISPDVLDAAGAQEKAEAAHAERCYDGPAPWPHLAVRSVLESAYFSAMARVAAEHGDVLVFPFLDREVLEFALSLGPQHRTHHYRDRAVTKLALRAAYRDVLPSPVVRDKLNGAEAAMWQHVVMRNRPQLLRLFDADSVLCELGIVNRGALRAVIEEGGAALQHSAQTLGRTLWLEAWLRSHFGVSLPTAPPQRLARREPGSSKVTHMRLRPGVRLHDVGGIGLLVSHVTGDMAELNADSLDLLRCLLDGGVDRIEDLAARRECPMHDVREAVTELQGALQRWIEPAGDGSTACKAGRIPSWTGLDGVAR